jgi:Protein of unknown function (DUF1475)
MSALRIATGVLALLLIAAIVWAVSQTGSLSDFRYETEALLEQPWGLVSLVDLYVGLAMIAMIMVLTERSFVAGALWALPLFVLGNVWTAIWLLLRLPSLAERLSRPDWPSEK